jgi:hypothetical protein
MSSGCKLVPDASLNDKRLALRTDLVDATKEAVQRAIVVHSTCRLGRIPAEMTGFGVQSDLGA